MKVLRLAAWVLCFAPLLGGAERLDRSDPPGRRAVAPGSGLSGALSGRSWHGRGFTPVTDEEWSKIEQWMGEYCPNRLAFFHRMEESPEKEHAKRLIADRYRQIDRTVYRPLKDAMLEEARAQDQIFGAQIQCRQARADKNSAMLKNAKADLHQAVSSLVDAELKQKNARIGKLQTEIQHLKDNRVALVQQWYDGMLRRADKIDPAPSSGQEAVGTPDTGTSYPGR